MTLATIPDPDPPGHTGYPTIVEHHGLTIVDTSYSERSYMVESAELNDRLKQLHAEASALRERYQNLRESVLCAAHYGVGKGSADGERYWAQAVEISRTAMGGSQ